MENSQETQIKQAVRTFLMHEQPSFLTREQTLELLCVGKGTLRRYVSDGVVREYRLGLRSYYNRTEILNDLMNSVI